MKIKKQGADGELRFCIDGEWYLPEDVPVPVHREPRITRLLNGRPVEISETVIMRHRKVRCA